MLDTDTKRRIDTARDILVGKVPDPKSQVEQITIALIYKFMDDMDAEAEELGGKRKFFTGDFARYGWAKLMRSGLGGHETLALYGEGITKMTENPGLPPLFRDIFKNAYLPYRDPETLKAFLKIIDEFTYDHSERLGDAFEYLLSVLGSQGDAGQFRTPRHIIDFIVQIVDPKKGETVLDPACGTAGFLISAYKHILRTNTDAKGHSRLTPDDRGRLAKNFKGYDISPDMVRLSLVNLYLHGFTDPHIYEYDTLTSEERWNEFADVILANPPFMSPKGGIKPHRRFSIQAKRSEVLFVDYIAEHLTPGGRAGIIVPEGIIFQSQDAYTDLRKLLVDTCLVAVISLPAGCFNPYSGVKTSILVLDKGLAKQAQTIAFFKVENDGFGLGAQRRAIEKNDLPQVQVELAAYLEALRSKVPTDALSFTTGLVVPKEKIAANGDYNLSGDRYKVGSVRTAAWPLVPLGSIATSKSGNGKIIKGTLATENDGTLYPAYSATGQDVFSPQYDYDGEGIVISAVGARCGKCFLATGRWQAIANTHVLLPDQSKVLTKYLYLFVNDENFWVKGGAAQPFVKVSASMELQIPLPPLEVQKEIVAEIEGYQKVINGARAVLDHYRPHIPIHPDWPMVELGEAADFISGYAFKSTDMTAMPLDTTYRRVVKIGNVGRDGQIDVSDAQFHAYSEDLARFVLRIGDVVMAMTGATVGKVAVVKEEGLLLNQRVGVLRAKPTALQSFVLHLLCSAAFYDFCQRTAGGGAQGNIAPREILEYQIPLPPLATQRAIVAEIEAEQALVAANRELITRFEQKIQATLARIWGEESAAVAAAD
jgi:type I restriction enzyme M protein